MRPSSLAAAQNLAKRPSKPSWPRRPRSGGSQGEDCPTTLRGSRKHFMPQFSSLVPAPRPRPSQFFSVCRIAKKTHKAFLPCSSPIIPLSVRGGSKGESVTQSPEIVEPAQTRPAAWHASSANLVATSTRRNWRRGQAVGRKQYRQTASPENVWACVLKIGRADSSRTKQGK
jgi:hypothetical protein